MTTLTQMRAQVRYKLLDLRNLDYLINTHKFEQTWKLIPDVEDLIRNCNIQKLRKIINKIEKNDLEDHSVAELRVMASRLGVPYFSKLHKDALIIQIKEQL